MKYLKQFKQVSEYEAFKAGDEYITPNVSFVEDSNEVMFGPVVKSLVYNMVDLGLPSGLLWADRNVGATSPEDQGLYFAWGDTVGYTAEQIANGEKAFASNWSDYFDTTDGGSTFNKYNNVGGLTVLQPEDDAATVNMGAEYRMPTEADFDELINNCTVSLIDLQGNEASSDNEYLKGIKFTGSNGNSIFIPSTGCYFDNGVMYGIFDYDSNLWSSSLGSPSRLDSSQSYNGCYFLFDGDLDVDKEDRYYGQPIRGVKVK